MPGIGNGRTGVIDFAFKKLLRKPCARPKLHEAWKSDCAPALRSAASNGQWPQVRLFRAGMVNDKLCKICGTHDGTLEHRHVCSTTANMRHGCPPDIAADRLVNGLSSDAKRILQTRGFMAAPDLSQHQPKDEEELHWEIRPDDGVIGNTCTVYTDGSMLDGPNRDVGRVGYGFCAYDHNGPLVAKAYGIPPK